MFMRSKYGAPHRAVLSSIPRSASHCWRAIHAQLDFVLSHALWSIGKGNIFLAWYVVEFSSAGRQPSSASYLCQRGLQWPQFDGWNSEYFWSYLHSINSIYAGLSFWGLWGQTSLATSSIRMPSLFLVHGNRRGLLILLSTGGNMFGINGYTQKLQVLFGDLCIRQYPLMSVLSLWVFGFPLVVFAVPALIVNPSRISLFKESWLHPFGPSSRLILTSQYPKLSLSSSVLSLGGLILFAPSILFYAILLLYLSYGKFGKTAIPLFMTM